MSDTNNSSRLASSPEGQGELPPSRGPLLSGDTGWPTVESLTTTQHHIEDDSRLWLSLCRELAKRRIPKEMFDLVPEDIWRFRVYGSKVVVMRTPRVTQVGGIALPDDATRPQETGWILTVGPHIHDTAEANIRGREYIPTGVPYSDFVPLLAVGDLVLINRHAGQPLVSSLLDDSAVHRSLAKEFILISIADVFGPKIDIKLSDWSSVQDLLVTMPSRTLIV